MQSVFDAHSHDATRLLELTWVLVAGAAVIFVVVMWLVGVAMRRRPAWLAADRAIVVGGIVVPVIVLTLLLVYALRVAASRAAADGTLRIEVAGHQWWWKVRYLDSEGRVDFETANEIRLPVGVRADVQLVSADVLHSFWVPSLDGKLDLVPGRVNRTTLAADREGVYRGQCAEYCGTAHAQMSLVVVAQAADAFEQWRSVQRSPAARADPQFTMHCAVCHTVRGTEARGTLGPDLTHVASRMFIGANVLPNDRANLARWIASSQHVKPGNLMPGFAHLPPSELAQLADYVAALR